MATNVLPHCAPSRTATTLRPHMPQQSHFEKLIAKKRQETLESMESIALGNSHQHAEIKGALRGLNMALECFKDAARATIDPDDGQ